MDTPIGRNLREQPWRWITMLLIGSSALAIHLFLEWRYRDLSDAYALAVLDCHEHLKTDSYDRRFERYEDAIRAHDRALDAYEASSTGWALLTLGTTLAYLALARGDRRAVGLIQSPVQGWAAWGRASAWVGGGVAAASLPVVAVWLWAGESWSPVWDCLNWDLQGFVGAPIFQEFLFRFAVCVPLAARFGAWPAIVASGTLFAAAHWIGGAQNPVNMIAGFFLAWAFLKRGTIVLPILLHAFGNLIGYSLLSLAAACGLQSVLG